MPVVNEGQSLPPLGAMVKAKDASGLYTSPVGCYVIMNDRNRFSGREFERLLEISKGRRIETSDRWLVPLKFRHGPRVS